MTDVNVGQEIRNFYGVVREDRADTVSVALLDHVIAYIAGVMDHLPPVDPETALTCASGAVVAVTSIVEVLTRNGSEDEFVELFRSASIPSYLKES